MPRVYDREYHRTYYLTRRAKSWRLDFKWLLMPIPPTNQPDYRYCSKCNSYKPVSEFYSNYFECTGCYKTRYKAGYLNMEIRAGYLLRRMSATAKKQNVPFEIDEAELVRIYKISQCQHCGQTLNYSPTAGVNQSTKATVDRLIPERGYVKGNLYMLCHDCNRRKQDSSPSQLRRLADWIDSNLRQ